MNGYKLLADGTRKALAINSDIEAAEREKMEQKIKVYEMLATLSNEEIMFIFDTGAFNDVTKSYCKRAMQLSEIPRDKQNEVLDNIKNLYETISASEIIK